MVTWFALKALADEIVASTPADMLEVAGPRQTRQHFHYIEVLTQ